MSPILRSKHVVGCLALLLGGLTMGSCGYNTKPLYSRAYTTIAVPVFGNKTFRRDWEARLTEAIKKNIDARTPYRLVNAREKADTVLEGEIVEMDENVLTRRPDLNLPRETEMTVAVNFTWKDKSGRTLVMRKEFNRSSTVIPQIGERVEDAEQMAIERLAAAIVDQLQTDW